MKSQITDFLDELKTTWDMSPEELNDIRQKMASYAMAATFDSSIREEVYKICSEQ